MNFATLIVSALMQGMIYAPLALGVFIAFNILKVSDLTLDGSFVFGMAVCAVLTISGHPVLALILGTLSGAAAGFITGILQTKLKINQLLSGILTMTALYTVNFAVLGGQANRYLTAKDPATGIPRDSATVFSPIRAALEKMLGEGGGRERAQLLNNVVPLAVAALAAILCVTILAVFFKTRTGLSVRAVGDNEEMVRSSSISADRMRIIGLMISNALVALSGAMLCQQQKFADLNSGSGMLIAGLAAVIIGQVAFGSRAKLTAALIAAVVGSLIYRVIIQLAYTVDIPSYFVKAISAVIVVVALSVPTVREKLGLLKIKQAAKKEAQNELDS